MPAIRASKSQGDRRCSFCSQVFLRSEHLARHVRIHTGEKPFACDICQRSYARYDTLQRHRRSHQESSSSSVETPAPGVQDSENGPTIGLDLQSEMRLTRQPHVSFEEPSEPHNTRMTTRNLTPNQPLNASNLNTTVSNDEAELRPNNAPAPAWDTLSLADDLNCSPGVPVSLGADELAPALALRECTSNAEYATSDIDAWDTAFDHNWAAWSVGQNFDLDAMNAAIAAAVELHHAPKRGLFNSEQEHPFEDDTLLTRRHQSTQKTMETIERSWISFSYPSTESNVLTGTVTPTNENDTGEKNDIDELYRYNLSSRLQHRPYDNSLPSTDFLNLSVRLYFSRFHPIFPLVHAPTFRPSMVKSLLLLSICSIGSLFMGSSSASLQGTRIFETLNKCIINSWDRYLARSRAEALSMIQASLLGQTFAILSGVPARLNLAQAYHGTIVAWSRQAKMFKETPSDLFNTSKDTGPGGLENVWRNWVQSQQHIRLVLGIQIHDAELAMMFHHEPLLRHEKEAFRTSSSEQLFNANSASSWLTMAQKVQKSERSGPISTLSSNIAHYLNMFDEYAKLDGINAAIHESRQQNRLGTQKQSQYAKDLMNWQKGAKELWKNPSSDSMCLTILWHAAFISLFTDFDKIEAVIGRDGPFGANQSQIYVTEWASSASAERCLAHALLLQRKVESIQFGQEPAIHVPRCLFQASLVWYMYGRHIPPNTSHPPLEFPEFKLIGAVMPQNMIPWNRREFGKLTALEFSTLSTLKDLLQRLGRWGLSKRYGSILGLLIEDKDHKT